MSNQIRRYLFWFAQEHVDFRLAVSILLLKMSEREILHYKK